MEKISENVYHISCDELIERLGLKGEFCSFRNFESTDDKSYVEIKMKVTEDVK